MLQQSDQRTEEVSRNAALFVFAPRIEPADCDQSRVLAAEIRTGAQIGEIRHSAASLPVVGPTLSSRKLRRLRSEFAPLCSDCAHTRATGVIERSIRGCESH